MVFIQNIRMSVLIAESTCGNCYLVELTDNGIGVMGIRSFLFFFDGSLMNDYCCL